MRRRTTVLVLAIALLLATLAAPASAVGVSANCATGLNFVTYVTATGYSDHVHDGHLEHLVFSGHKSKAVNWGYETGTEYGSVSGPNWENPGAYCFG